MSRKALLACVDVLALLGLLCLPGLGLGTHLDVGWRQRIVPSHIEQSVCSAFLHGIFVNGLRSVLEKKYPKNPPNSSVTDPFVCFVCLILEIVVFDFMIANDFDFLYSFYFFISLNNFTFGSPIT